MRYTLILIAAFVLTNSQLFAQTYKRQENESTEAFAKRLKPDSVLFAHSIIETNVWSKTQKAIIVFWGSPFTEDKDPVFSTIEGHLYLPINENEYREIRFASISEDGGPPEIVSVFFTNADNDSMKELVVISKCSQSHYDYYGAFYDTFIFDNPTQADYLTYLEKLSKTFTGCECTWREGKSETAKYKTAESVKRKLKAMRF